MKNLLLLFTFLFSFSASSAVYKATKNGANPALVTGCTGVSIGVVYDPASLPPCLGKEFLLGDTSYRGVSSNYGSSLEVTALNLRTGRKSIGKISGTSSSCSSIDPDTGLCSPEPEPLFCDSQEVQDWILHDQSACQSNGGKFGFTCDDVAQKYESTCDSGKPPVCDENSPDWPACADVPDCSMGNVGYPACLWPPEPVIPDNPNIPPSGGDDSGAGGGTHDPTEPLDPNPEIPPVETLPPEEGNGNILKSIADLNTDNNNLITRLNKDLNVGLSDVGSYLDVLNDNTISLLELSRLGFDNINQSINNQNDVIRQSGNMTNNYLDTLTNVTGNGLQDVVDALGADKMVTPSSYIAPPLYSSHQMATLDAEVAGLKIQYTNQLNEFKSYFNFNTDVNSGEYNAHTLKQRWGGQELSFDSFALKVFVDNANIIGLIIIFGFGMAGIRVILETI